MTNTFRSNPFDLAVDTISASDLAEMVAWMKDFPRLTMADLTRQFEQAWSAWLGTKYSVFYNSGSSANLMMYAALEEADLAGTKKIVVPATGWATTVAPAMQLGWQPIMCDTDPQTFGLDLDRLEEILKTERPDAVIMVHVLGVPNDMRRVMELQKKYGFALLEDCCASHGARHQGRLVGTFGTMSSFSFYYGHHMSTIEGGMVCTNDEKVYYRLLMLRSHGWMKDLPEQEYNRMMAEFGIDKFHSPFTFVLPGYNLRPTDLQSKLGLIQLRTLDETVKRRVAHHLHYQRRLQGHFEFAHAVPGDTISSISFCAVASSPEERKQIVHTLAENHIDTRLFTAANLGRHPFWHRKYGVFDSPMADRLYQGGFFLPNNQAITSEMVDRVCDVVVGVVA